jgi:hypothetical protein
VTKTKPLKPVFEAELSSVSKPNSKPGRPALILRKEATKYNGKYKTRFRKRSRKKETNSLAVLRCYLLGEDKGVPIHDMKVYRCMALLILSRGITARWAVHITAGIYLEHPQNRTPCLPKSRSGRFQKEKKIFLLPDRLTYSLVMIPISLISRKINAV